MEKLPLVDRCSRVIGESMSYVYFLSVAIIGFEVVARYFFNAPTIWAHESVIALTALGFIFGGVYAMQRGAHVRIFVVVQLLPKHWQRRIEIFNQALICAYLCVFIYACWGVAERSIQQWETSASAWNQPTPVLVKTALVVGGIAILIQSFAFLIRLIRGHSIPTSDAQVD
ncbi:MAG: TRAP transporter small permease [Pseudomonadota bacterium]